MVLMMRVARACLPFLLIEMGLTSINCIKLVADYHQLSEDYFYGRTDDTIITRIL